MSEFLQTLLQFAEAGDWNAAWILIVSVLAPIFGGTGFITALVVVGKLLINVFSNKKTFAEIASIVTNKTQPLQEALQDVKQQLTIATKETLDNLKVEFLQQLRDVQSNYDTLLINQEAFNATVLNNETLKLQYENLQKQLLIARQKGEKIVDNAKIELENVKQDANTTLNSVEQAVASVNAEIKQVVKEAEQAVKTQIRKHKKKAKNVVVAEVEYVD